MENVSAVGDESGAGATLRNGAWAAYTSFGRETIAKWTSLSGYARRVAERTSWREVRQRDG